MAEPFATLDDLAQRWRDIAPSDQERADTLLVDASTMIRARFPGIDRRVGSGVLDAGVPRMIVCAIVKRALQADTDTPPVTQTSESFAGFNYQNTFANPTGDLYLTGQELKLLQPARRAGMVDMMPDPGRARR